MSTDVSNGSGARLWLNSSPSAILDVSALLLPVLRPLQAYFVRRGVYAFVASARYFPAE